MKKIIITILLLSIISTINFSQEVKPKITKERKKLVILTNEDDHNEISDKIYQIASSAATKLKRYDVIEQSHKRFPINL